MAKKEKTTTAVVRSGYVQKCLDSNALYTLYIGPKDKEIVMEIPKSWFRGVGRPKKGSKITLIQKNGGTTRMLVDNKQFYPSLSPLSLKAVASKK